MRHATPTTLTSSQGRWIRMASCHDQVDGSNELGPSIAFFDATTTAHSASASAWGPGGPPPPQAIYSVLRRLLTAAEVSPPPRS